MTEEEWEELKGYIHPLSLEEYKKFGKARRSPKNVKNYFAPTKEKNHRRYKYDIPIDEILAMIKAEMSVEKIGNHFNVGGSYIYKLLKKEKKEIKEIKINRKKSSKSKLLTDNEFDEIIKNFEEKY